MINELLTNYDNFDPKQMDYENILSNKIYYNIYNNKINQPLQKFWFSISNLKYTNQYNDYKILRFFINDKIDKSKKLINFIKNISIEFQKHLNKEFENILIDYPWKEYTNYPTAFSFFTNNKTLFFDEFKNNLEINKLNINDTYAIIFEITNLKIIKSNLDTFTLKINLSLLLIQSEKQKDFKSFNFNDIQLKSNSNNNILPLPFLKDIQKTNILKENNINNNSKNNNEIINKDVAKIDLNPNQLIEIKNSLKKVCIDTKTCNSDDNNSEIKEIYINQKNKLKKITVLEKSLLNNINLKNKKNKKIKKIKKTKKNILNNLDIELEMELEQKINNY